MGRKRRSDPARQGFPALTGQFVVDVVRGRTRVRAWPRKRGSPKSPITQQQNADFALRQKHAKFADAAQQIEARRLTKGTGLYPRDLLTRAMAVGLYDVLLPDGRIITHRRNVIVPTTFSGAIIAPASSINIGTNAWKAVPWPLPVIDTAAFWSAGAPTIFTVPPGVTMVQCAIGTQQGSAAGGRIMSRFLLNGTIAVALGGSSWSGTVVHGMNTGPFVVAPGDTITPQFFMQASGVLLGGGATHVSIEVKEAT